MCMKAKNTYAREVYYIIGRLVRIRYLESYYWCRINGGSKCLLQHTTTRKQDIWLRFERRNGSNKICGGPVFIETYRIGLLSVQFVDRLGACLASDMENFSRL